MLVQQKKLKFKVWCRRRLKKVNDLKYTINEIKLSQISYSEIDLCCFCTSTLQDLVKLKMSANKPQIYYSICLFSLKNKPIRSVSLPTILSASYCYWFRHQPSFS